MGEDLGVGWWFLWSAVGRERERTVAAVKKIRVGVCEK